MRIGQITAETCNPGEYRLRSLGEPPQPCGIRPHSGRYAWRFESNSALISLPDTGRQESVRGRFFFRFTGSTSRSAFLRIGNNIAVSPDGIWIDGRRVGSIDFRPGAWESLGFGVVAGTPGRFVLYNRHNRIGEFAVDIDDAGALCVGGPWDDGWLDDFYLDSVASDEIDSPTPLLRFVPTQVGKPTPKDEDGFATTLPVALGDKHTLRAVIPAVATSADGVGTVVAHMYDGRQSKQAGVSLDENGVYTSRWERQPDGSEWRAEDFANMRFKFTRGE